jgi:hypothetical protein
VIAAIISKLKKDYNFNIIISWFYKLMKVYPNSKIVLHLNKQNIDGNTMWHRHEAGRAALGLRRAFSVQFHAGPTGLACLDFYRWREYHGACRMCTAS